MLKYPMKFDVSCKAQAGISQTWEAKASAVETSLVAAVPTEFGGPGGGFSPEDFFALAIANCFVATFKVYAEKSSLNFKDLNVDVALEVDRDEKGFPWMARASLMAKLYSPSSRELAESLLNKSFKGCLVMNSIKTEKTATFEIID